VWSGLSRFVPSQHLNHPIEVNISAGSEDSGSLSEKTYVGNRIVVLIPPGQAFVGKLTESTLLSEHGAALSPPKFGAV